MFKFLKAARSLVNQGMSKEAIEQFARNEFGEINELFQKQIDNLFKKKEGIENIKIKDPDFDDTIVEMQFDEFGPFNPKDPLKNLNKQTKPMRYRGPDEFDTRKQYEEYLDTVLGPPDEVFGNPLKDDLLKEFDKVKAKNVTPKMTEIEEAIDNASPGFAGDRKYDAQLVADSLAEKRFNKEFYDLDQKQQMDLYGEALDGLSKPKFRLNVETFKKDFNVSDEEVEKILALSPEEQQKILQDYIDKDFKQQIELMDFEPPEGSKGNAQGGLI